jgi:hypothetical protein
MLKGRPWFWVAYASPDAGSDVLLVFDLLRHSSIDGPCDIKEEKGMYALQYAREAVCNQQQVWQAS